MLAAYLAAELAVLKGQTYRIGDLTLTRSNLNEIVAARKEWERKVNVEVAKANGQKGPLSVYESDFNHGRTPLAPDDSGEFAWHF